MRACPLPYCVAAKPRYRLLVPAVVGATKWWGGFGGGGSRGGIWGRGVRYRGRAWVVYWMEHGEEILGDMWEVWGEVCEVFVSLADALGFPVGADC